jgi:hypothetical protein
MEPFPDIYLLFDTNGHFNARIHDKRHYFNFAIIIVPPRDSYLPTAPACGVYIDTIWNHSQDIPFYDTFDHKMYLNAFPLFYLVLGRGRGWEKSEYKQQDRSILPL